MMGGNGELSVPPGFRFHPTDEELLYYYLRKKVSYEAIDLDVIREVDLNKLEPWDLKDKCRIGSGPQNEWYFFSHKDKKYPTGTRTNRATAAGFWKATGRDKAIFHVSSSNSNKRIGMRKTLVFYTGRAPHGHKTDWIMHEYRLDVDDHHHHNNNSNQEDGWVVCRVFKKKNQISRGSNNFLPEEQEQDQEQDHHHHYLSHINPTPPLQTLQNHHHFNSINFDASMHLPHLFSPESAPNPTAASSFASLNTTTAPFNTIDMECSQNLLSLTSSAAAAPGGLMQQERFNADWSFLDKLLASHQNPSSQNKLANHSMGLGLGSQLALNHKFSFPYLGEAEIMKFSK